MRRFLAFALPALLLGGPLLAGRPKADRAALRLQTSHWQPPGVTAFALSGDGQLLATAGRDGVRLWDAASGQLIHFLPDVGIHIESLALSPDGKRLAVGRAILGSRVYDTTTGRRAFDLTVKGIGHSLGSRVAFSPDGKRVALASAREVLLFDADTGKLDKTLALGGEDTGAVGLAFRPDGRALAVAGLGKGRDEGKLIDLATGKEIVPFPGVGAVSFSPDGTKLVFARKGKAVEVRPANPFGAARLPIELADQPAAVAFGRGGLLATLDATARVRLFDARGKERPTAEKMFANPRAGLTFSADGKRLLAASGKVVLLLDVSTGKRAAEVGGDGVLPARRVALSPDGRALAVVFRGTGPGRDGLVLLDLATGKEKGLRSKLTTVRAALPTFSPDGKEIAALVEGPFGQFYLETWDVSTGKGTFSERFLLGAANEERRGLALAFSPDRKWLAAGYALRRAIGKEDKLAPAEVLLLDRAGTTRRLALPGGPVNAVRFSPDGKKLLAGSPGRVTEWDVAGGKEVRVIEAPKGGWVEPVALSPDGKVLVAFGGPVLRAGRRLAAYDLATGKKLLELEESEYSVGLGSTFPGRQRAAGSVVVFAPEGTLFVTGNSLSHWDVAKGKRLARSELVHGRRAAVGVGGRKSAAVAVAEADGTITFRAVEGAGLRELARLGLVARGGWAAIAAGGRYDYSGEAAPTILHGVIDGRPRPLASAPFRLQRGLLPRALGLSE